MFIGIWFIASEISLINSQICALLITRHRSFETGQNHDSVITKWENVVIGEVMAKDATY